MVNFLNFRKEKREATPNVKFVSTVSFDELFKTGNSSYVSLADNPDVRIAVDTIAELVSNMSIHLLESTENGSKRVNNELAHLIDVEPAIGMTRKAWIAKVVRDLYLHGNGNSIARKIVSLKTGLLEELRPLDMSYVSYQYDDVSNNVQIKYRNQDLSSEQVVHFVINPNPHYPKIGDGYGDILQDVLQNLSQAQKTKATFMRGRFMPNIIIKVDSDSEELSNKEGREKVKDKYLDSDGGLEPMVVPADLMEVQSVKPLSLKDIAINESVEIDKKTVAGMFGIPPFLLGVGTFNKEEFNNFVNTRIASLGYVIAQTLTRDVLLNPNWYFQFNPRSLYSYDITELVNAGKEMVDRTAMVRNEWREWVGLEPRDDMEELITLENYIPTDKLGEQSKLKGGDSDGSETETN